LCRKIAAFMQCRICAAEGIEPFLSLGKSPPANNLVPPDNACPQEQSYPLAVCFCPKCTTVQLTFTVPPEVMFSHYLYVTSTTKTFRDHFAAMAKSLSGRFNLSDVSFVIDVGSNDGLLLKCFQGYKVRTLGIEPAKNLAEAANREGVETLNAFLSPSVAGEIAKKHGRADVVTANNVFAHIPAIHDVVKSVRAMLSPQGAFVIEVAYLFDMLSDMTFDLIYHEHLFYYSLTSLCKLLSMHGMEVFDVEHVSSHGGSLRVFVQFRDGPNQVCPSVGEMLSSEKSKGVIKQATYGAFAQKVQEVREELVSYLAELKSEGKRVAAFGYPAKATTLLNFCGISKQYIDYIVDDNPLKQGYLAPGTHIPIVSSSRFREEKPDYVLILAWNFAKEIIEKSAWLREQGVSFIIPLPKPRILHSA